MELLILCIEFIINKLDFGVAVTIDTPAHTQIAYLSYPVHPLYVAMAGATFNFPHGHMLGMTEKDMVLQIVHLDPLDGNTTFPGFNHFVNLVFPGMGSFPHNGVTVPADTHIWYACMFGVSHCGVAVLAIDLVIESMNHMGELHRLVGFVILLSAQRSPCLIEQFGLPAKSNSQKGSPEYSAASPF